MSMPILTYGCTACDIKCWDSVTWGYRYYQVAQERVRINVEMGWCHDCNNFAPVEKRPQASTEQLLLAEQEALQGRIREMQQRIPRPRFWFIRSPKPIELLEAEYELEKNQEDLNRLRLLLPLMAERQSGDRCLACSSEACFRVPQHEVYASFDVNFEQPVPLDCTHPSCGGHFTVSSDGMRLNVAGRSRAYNLNGMPLGGWESL